MNYIVIGGHLGADPEVRFTAGGQKVTTLRVACRSRKNDTIWYKVTLWGDQFDKMITYFKKGSSIVVVGELMPVEIFTDRNGKTQASLQIVASQVSFSPFGKGKSEGGGQQGGADTHGGFGGFEQTSGGPSGGMQDAPMGGGFEEEEIPF